MNDEEGKKPPSRSYGDPFISAEDYGHDYYQSCEGHEVFNASRGHTLTPRLSIPLQLADIRNGMNILDIGSGRGEIILHTVRKGAISVGCDYAWEAVKIASHNLNQELTGSDRGSYLINQSDARNLPYKKESFDRVLMLDIVEHLHPKELNLSLLEAYRVLKPGGKLIVHTMPNIWYYRFGYPLYRFVQLLRRNRLPADPRQRWSYGHLHVNEQSLWTLKNYLNHNGFKSKVWLASAQNYDYEENRLVRWGMESLSRYSPFKYIFCNDIFAIGEKFL